MEGRLLEARPAQVADLSSWQGGVSSALRLCGSFLGSPWRPPPALSALVSPQAGSPSSCQGIQCGALPTSAPGPADGSAVMSASQESRAARGHPVCPRLRPPVLGGTGGRQGPTLCECSFARARRRLPRLLSIFCLRFSTAVTFFIIFTGVCVFNFLYHFSSKTCIHSNTSQCRTI